MKKIGCIVGVFLVFISCTQHDEKASVSLTQNQKEIIKEYKNISYISNTYPDSLLIYANRLERSSSKESNLYKAMAAYVKGVYYQNSSSYELSKKQYEKVLKLVRDSKYDTIKARTYIGLANYYQNTGDFPKAFQYNYQSLKIYETFHNPYGISSSNTSIAQIYLQKNDLESAKEHLKIALKSLGNDKANQFYLIASHTLANIYGMSGNYKSALAIDEECIRIADQIHSPRNKASFIDNKANCLMYSNQLDSAAYYFNKCLEIDLVIGEKKQIADTYANLGNLALFRKDYPNAEKHLQQSIALLKEIRQKPNLIETYAILVELYQKQGLFSKALAVQLEKETIYQQMISEKKEAALAEFKIVYETQKKEQQLAENKLLLLQKEADVQQKNNILIAVSALAFFIALIGMLIYRQQKIKNKQQEQEFQLKSAITQIETQNQLQEQRLTISRDLHDNIGAQLTFIISSIENIKYAFDITNPSLHSKLYSITTFAKETIVELRDTIWAMNNNEITFEELRSRILNFMGKAKDATEKIDFKFNIADNLSDITMTSIVGMNCYRAVQEAVNNAIKYAEASQIEVSVARHDTKIQIQITDNGIGFDTQQSEMGNGFQNMQKRIDEIAGILSVKSTIGEGTTILIIFNL